MEHTEENKLNSENIWKIQSKIVKWYGNYGRKVSWIMKRYGKHGRKASLIVKRYRKYRRKESWIVKRFGKYRTKLWNNMEIKEEK
jgi:hypothetical protein